MPIPFSFNILICWGSYGADLSETAPGRHADCQNVTNEPAGKLGELAGVEKNPAAQRRAGDLTQTLREMARDPTGQFEPDRAGPLGLGLEEGGSTGLGFEAGGSTLAGDSTARRPVNV